MPIYFIPCHFFLLHIQTPSFHYYESLKILSILIKSFSTFSSSSMVCESSAFNSVESVNLWSILTRNRSLQFGFTIDHSQSNLPSDTIVLNIIIMHTMHWIENSFQLTTNLLNSFQLEQFLCQSSSSFLMIVESWLHCK